MAPKKFWKTPCIMGNFVVFYISFQGLLFIYAEPLCGNSFWFNALFTPLPFYLSPLTANLSSLPSALTSLRFHLTINFYLFYKNKAKVNKRGNEFDNFNGFIVFSGEKIISWTKETKNNKLEHQSKTFSDRTSDSPFSHTLFLAFSLCWSFNIA